MVENSIRPAGGKQIGKGNLPLVKQAEKILKITYLEAKIFKSAVIGTEHLLLSILKDEDNVATKSLNAFNIDYDVAKEEFETIISDNITPSVTFLAMKLRHLRLKTNLQQVILVEQVVGA